MHILSCVGNRSSLGLVSIWLRALSLGRNIWIVLHLWTLFLSDQFSCGVSVVPLACLVLPHLKSWTLAPFSPAKSFRTHPFYVFSISLNVRSIPSRPRSGSRKGWRTGLQFSVRHNSSRSVHELETAACFVLSQSAVSLLRGDAPTSETRPFPPHPHLTQNQGWEKNSSLLGSRFVKVLFLRSY